MCDVSYRSISHHSTTSETVTVRVQTSIDVFLTRDATQSAVSLRQVVCPSVRFSVRLSVTLRYSDHIGWILRT